MKSKEIIVLVVIVLFDLLTKVMANYYLPFHENLPIVGDEISLYLTYNQGATGEQGAYILREESNKNLAILLACISGFILLSYIILIRKASLKVIYKVLIGITLFLSLSIAMEIMRPLFENFSVTSWTASVAHKTTGLIICSSLFYWSTDKWIRLFILIILAGGIGNLVSHFYPPYRVINFVNISGSYEHLRIGVFNFADIAFYLGAIGLVISIAAMLINRIFSKQRVSATEK